MVEEGKKCLIRHPADFAAVFFELNSSETGLRAAGQTSLNPRSFKASGGRKEGHLVRIHYPMLESLH